MGLAIEHECPQCGGAIILDETDRFIRCPYCNVQNFLSAPGYFRFVLPHKANHEDIIFAPYLRFKGNVYFCRDESIGYRFIDITHLGLELRGLPASLGLRPQAMKMKFLSSDHQGSFLRFSLKASDIVAKAARISSGPLTGDMLHRAYIGETLSLIYLPVYVQSNKLFDAVLDRPMADLPSEKDVLGPNMVPIPDWKLSFIATLCPQCGWNLEGEKDSVILFCDNCGTAWEARVDRFKEIAVYSVPGQNTKTVYLPFWKTRAESKGIDIRTFADFIRITNQPLVINTSWEGMDMCFWSPAFKIRPKLFLQLAKQITVSQYCLSLEKKVPETGRYPVTLAGEEAAQAMRLTLADSAVHKENIFPYLPIVHFDIKDYVLVFLPFSDTGHELVLQTMPISVNKQSLGFGRQL